MAEHSHYLQKTCQPQYKINKVRVWPHHPIRTYFPNPNRKAYVIENRTDEKQLLSISDVAWIRKNDDKFFTLEPFSEETFFVNTSLEPQQFVRIHRFEDGEILDSKFLNWTYSLASIFKDLQCKPRLQLQYTPGF